MPRIENKRVRDAVNSLVLSNPLYAGILLQQRFEALPEIETFAVDGSRFVYSPTFADSLTFDECKGVCAHEACHLAGCHHARQGSRDQKLWNEACDHVINPQLLREGFKLPKGALNDPRYHGKSAEDVYAILYRENPPNGNGNGQGAQQTPSFGQVLKAPGNANQAAAKAKSQVEQAMSIAKIAGSMTADEMRKVRQDLEPRYDWKDVLNRFMQEVTQRDFSWSKPNKRWINRDLILPSLASRDIGRIVLAIDTSGSVSTAQVSAMVSEMRSCLDAYAENGISQPLTVIYCDAEVNGVETLEAGDTPSPKGGGGTMFAPVFNHLQGDLDGAACLVYLTDGYCGDTMESLANLAPNYPVLWGLICDNDGFKPPFGECVKVDIHA